MSDPNYVPPPTSQTDSDAALARSLAASETNSRPNPSTSPSGRGGVGSGLNLPSFSGGNWFGSNNTPQPQQPTYNPHALNYQPRQKKAVPSQNARAAYHAPPMSNQDPNYPSPLISGFPGSNEAKQWEESINKFAESE